MFTGLIESLGSLASTRSIPGGLVLSLRHDFTEPLPEGASVAVNGVCLTVLKDTGGIFTAECYWETLKKTALPGLRPGSPVNLERALRADGMLDGHLVQGHVTGTARVHRSAAKGKGRELTVTVPDAADPALIPEGSVALDGVSLTIASLQGAQLTVQLIGETLERTTLKDRRPGDTVNLETDFLLRRRRAGQSNLTMSRLAQWGYV